MLYIMMMGSRFYLLFLFGIPFLSVAQQLPKKYTAHYVAKPMVIDGFDTNEEWQKINWTDNFIDIEGKKVPKYDTAIKMAWDNEHFYVYAKMEEPHVWGSLKQRDTVIFYNNDFEVFIDPDGDTHEYYELEINALNTVWDLMLTKPYRNGGRAIDSWDIRGLKSAVKINGSINKPDDIDQGWNLELAIPWNTITETSNGKNPPLNEIWRINFSRVNWEHSLKNKSYTRKKDENGKYLAEYNWVWSPQGVINMHEPEHWGYVFFSDKDSGLNLDEDENLKYAMYAVYRRLITNDQADFPETIEVLNRKIPLNLEKHKAGWNLYAKSPFSNKTLTIQHNGKYLNK